MPGEPFWLQNPVKGSFFITSRFNDPREYTATPKKKQLHEGLDLKAIDPGGRPLPVLAAQRGIVDKVGFYAQGYGKYVRIKHAWPDGRTYVTWYGHLSDTQTQEGQFVSAGDRIGTAGETGFAFGVHLHLTLQCIGCGASGYVVDDVIDPQPFFQGGDPQEHVDEAMFVRDETIPDGTLVDRGSSLVKSWVIRNSGTRAWGPGYSLVFFDGEAMGCPESVPLPPAKPGEEVIVSVPLVAPEAAGRHRGAWKPSDASGKVFEFALWVDLVVSGPTGQDGARFVGDVTIPDGAAFLPGQTFLKKWRVRNSGDTVWSNGYRLAHFDDEQMGGPDNVPVPMVRAGEEGEVSITLTAPQEPGAHRSTWRLRNAQGQFFGEHLYALIDVPLPEGHADELVLVDDVTYADGTVVQPGQAIQKVWRVRNAGSKAWGAGYRLTFLAGQRMGGPESIPLPPAAPGQTVDITLSLTAPKEPGTHFSTWRALNPQGDAFDIPVYLQVRVLPVAGPGDQVDDSKFVRDVTILDKASIKAGAAFLKIWRIRNTGTTTWDERYRLVHIQDDPMGGPEGVPLPLTAPGDTADISVNLTAPLVPGLHRSAWKIRSPQGQLFGQEVYTLIRVPSPVVQPPDNRALFMGHDNLEPWSILAPGQAFEKQWRVRNNGRTAWGEGYTLAFLDGEQMGGPESVAIPHAESLESIRVAAGLIAPAIAGNYKGYWRLRDPQGELFGPRLPVWITVKS